MEEQSDMEKSKQWPQVLAVLAALILAMSSGTHAAWVSPAQLILLSNNSDFNATHDQTSYLVMLYPLGYIISSPTTAFLLDKIGRKHSMLCLAFPQILAWLLIAFGTKIYVFYAARLISGFAEGNIFCIVPIYICEISEPIVRGRLGIFYSTAFTFGLFLMNIYGSYLRIRDSAFVSLFWPIIFLLTFVWMPESPYYFLMKGDTERARISLQKLRKMKNVERELIQLTADVQRQISESGTFKDVFSTESNIKSLLIIMGLRTLQQFSGGTPLLYYSQTMFENVHGGISYSTSAIIFTGCLTSVSSLGMFLVDGHGRRPLMLISTSATVFCLLIEAIYFHLQFHKYDVSKLSWVPITGMIFYTIVRGIGLISIPSLMTGELFSASIKGKAMSILNIYLAFTIISSSKLFHILHKNYGMYGVFSMFVVGAIIGVVFVYYCVPETKGKTLEEIQQELKGNRK